MCVCVCVCARVRVRVRVVCAHERVYVHLCVYVYCELMSVYAFMFLCVSVCLVPSEETKGCVLCASLFSCTHTRPHTWGTGSGSWET